MSLGFISGKVEKILPDEQVEPRVGSRLLPQVVDELARSSPDKIYASIPRSSDPSQEFRDVTILELAQAVNHFAWWLDEHPLLVEPKDSRISKDLLMEIWPTIEQANLQAPSHARIIKSMIAVTNPDHSFERAGKGTIIRKMTAEKFAPEVDALYSADFGSLKNGPIILEQDKPKSIRKFVRSCVNSSFSAVGLDDDDDFFVLGLDSLKTVEITALLKNGLKASNTL